MRPSGRETKAIFTGSEQERAGCANSRLGVCGVGRRSANHGKTYLLMHLLINTIVKQLFAWNLEQIITKALLCSCRTPSGGPLASQTTDEGGRSRNYSSQTVKQKKNIFSANVNAWF